MTTHIEGSIGWNLLQLDHVFDRIGDPLWSGFGKDSAMYTMNVYLDRINAQTRLAYDWNWKNAYYSWILYGPGLNRAQQVLAGIL